MEIKKIDKDSVYEFIRNENLKENNFLWGGK